jgi:hypothetical protein
MIASELCKDINPKKASIKAAKTPDITNITTPYVVPYAKYSQSTTVLAGSASPPEHVLFAFQANEISYLLVVAEQPDLVKDQS